MVPPDANTGQPLRAASRRRATRVLALCALLCATLPPLASCTTVALGVANAPALVGDHVRHANLPYADGPRGLLDVYAPAQAARAPVVVFWYGGSWTAGSKGAYRFVGATLAADGIVTVIPDYRLYPEVRFPTFLDDAATALRWVRDHIEEYGGDPERIWLMGHSAGAHMAAMLALDGRRLAAVGVPRASIRGLIGLSGPYALEPNSDELRHIFAAPYTALDWQPYRFADATSPPTLLLHGAADTVVVPGHADRLAEALRSAGVAVELQIYPERKHADTVAALSLPGRGRAPVREAIRDFIFRTSVVDVSRNGPPTGRVP